jgi:hypothetical protein
VSGADTTVVAVALVPTTVDVMFKMLDVVPTTIDVMFKMLDVVPTTLDVMFKMLDVALTTLDVAEPTGYVDADRSLSRAACVQ